MSQIAEETGIGRATLYKYFPEVEAILVAWHTRHVTAHLKQLAGVRDQTQDPGDRVEAVLTACAHIAYQMATRGTAQTSPHCCTVTNTSPTPSDSSTT